MEWIESYTQVGECRHSGYILAIPGFQGGHEVGLPLSFLSARDGVSEGEFEMSFGSPHSVVIFLACMMRLTVPCYTNAVKHPRFKGLILTHIFLERLVRPTGIDGFLKQSTMAYNLSGCFTKSTYKVWGRIRL